MKKIVTFFLCTLTLVCLFAMPACRDKNENQNENTGPNAENGTQWPDEWDDE